MPTDGMEREPDTDDRTTDATEAVYRTRTPDIVGWHPGPIGHLRPDGLTHAVFGCGSYRLPNGRNY